MKYLVFVICCLTLAYAEEVKLGLQMLSTTNGRTSQRFNSPSGGRVAQQRLANGNGFSNFRPATSPSSNGNGFSNFRPATSPSSNGNGFSNIRQTRAAFPASFAGPYGTNYAGEDFVGQFGRYNPMFVGQGQFGRSPLPGNSYGNPFMGRQAFPSYALTGFEPNPAAVRMAQEAATFGGVGANIPWSALIQNKLDNEVAMGLQPILGQSFYGSPVGAIGQQTFFGPGRQVFPGSVYGLGQYGGALPYGQPSYRPTQGQQLFRRAPYYARRK